MANPLKDILMGDLSIFDYVGDTCGITGGNIPLLSFYRSNEISILPCFPCPMCFCY